MQKIDNGQSLNLGGGRAVTNIPRGHKVAARTISKGKTVTKYGQIIEHATQDIQAGDHVPSHNLGMSDHSEDYAISQDAKPTDFVPADQRDTFMGYKRGDGKSGTRNYGGISSSVNCLALRRWPGT